MSAEVFYQAMGLQGCWVVDVWESRGGEIEGLVEPPRESLRCRSCRSRRGHIHERKLIPHSDNSPWSCRTSEDSRKEPDSNRLREHPLEAERSWPDFDDDARPSRRRTSSRWHMVPVAASAVIARTPS